MSDTYDSTEKQASYGIGIQMAEQFSTPPFKGFDKDACVAGFTSQLLSKDLSLDAATINKAFQEIQKVIAAEQAEKQKNMSAEGEAFLAENAKKETVTVTDSGLQYEVLETGDGEKPAVNSTVRTHYHGTLIDGTVFDSSYDRGQPAEFPVNGVIAGWTEALQMMNVGSKWRLTIPYNLAYGEQGAGGQIGPYATLVFDVELLAIV